MRGSAVLAVGAFLALCLAACGGAQAGAGQGAPLPFWTVASSETWAGAPSPAHRFMATVGGSELSAGLQASGFRGSADLAWTPHRTPPGVHRVVTLTALQARVIAVTRDGDSVAVIVQPSPQGYQLVAVDMTQFRTGAVVRFTFQDPERRVLATDRVRMEAPSRVGTALSASAAFRRITSPRSVCYIYNVIYLSVVRCLSNSTQLLKPHRR